VLAEAEVGDETGGIGSQKLTSRYARTTATAALEASPNPARRAIMTASTAPRPPGVGEKVPTTLATP